MRRGAVVWEPDGRGWRRVRGRVPAGARSAQAFRGSPGPPRSGSHAAGAEDVRAVSQRPELELLGAELARELARDVVDRLGALTTAIVVGVLFLRRKAKR